MVQDIQDIFTDILTTKQAFGSSDETVHLRILLAYAVTLG
jgi:hypothetical protein